MNGAEEIDLESARLAAEYLGGSEPDYLRQAVEYEAESHLGVSRDVLEEFSSMSAWARCQAAGPSRFRSHSEEPGYEDMVDLYLSRPMYSSRGSLGSPDEEA